MPNNRSKFIFKDVQTLQRFSPVVDMIRYHKGNDAAKAFADALVAKQYPIRIAVPLIGAFSWFEAEVELDCGLTHGDFVATHLHYQEATGYVGASTEEYYKRVEELRDLGVAIEVDANTGEVINEAITSIPPEVEAQETTLLSKDFQVGGDHYSKLTIQPWDVMRETLGNEAFCGFLHSNVIKYVMRDKNGVEDLKKAQHHLSVLIAEIEGADDGQS